MPKRKSLNFHETLSEKPLQVCKSAVFFDGNAKGLSKQGEEWQIII